MALFGRKKDEEEFDDDPSNAYASEGKGEFSRRRLRDLKPENRKKRKEPPKPWGKRERLTLLIVILATVIISGILTFTSEGKGQLNLPKPNFSLPKMNFDSLNFFKEETITIKKSGN
ncbi:MAG: hypothetical protein HYV90_00560 [Candidatus Woesebacteria bacterium]|nr:MAG: hypothetical protein HYV90_00560 [Candidatus Woesebacteria bacterium]